MVEGKIAFLQHYRHTQSSQWMQDSIAHHSDKGDTCDRIGENPLYGMNVQITQCMFLVPKVENYQTLFFVSKNLSAKYYRQL